MKEIKWRQQRVFKKMENFLKPENVLKELDLKPDMVAAEFGCGSGGFAIPLAKKLEDGLVYALDVQKAPLSALKSKAIFEKIVNIRIIHCDLEKPRGSKLIDSCSDLVLVANILFQCQDKNAIINEAKRVLRKDGKLVIIEWLAKVPAQELKKMSEEAGFKLIKEFPAGKYHYCLVFEKIV